MWDRVGVVSCRFVDKWEQQNVPIIIIIVMAVIPFYDNQSLRANTLNVLLSAMEDAFALLSNLPHTLQIFETGPKLSPCI